MDAQFEKFWQDEESTFLPLPFPDDNKELKEWCRQSFSAGRAAGIKWAERFTAEQCCQLVADRLYNGSIIGAALLIKERFGLEI